jgi:glycosyltransferase involved in cell wall biosynthesis
MLNIWKFHLLDVPLLRLFGKNVIVHFRGLDAVDIKYFDYKRALARGEVTQPPSMSRPEQLRKLKFWERWASYILVSEPDLHFVSQRSILSPQVIDLNYWKCDNDPSALSHSDGIIRVVHAPSSRRKKGTDFIELAVSELKADGVPIELLLAENLPHDEIRDIYAKADIGIDQVLYGWHGKVSVELMALGKPVICNIDPELRKFRSDLPIVHGDPSNLKQVIKALASDKDLRYRLGLEGISYVQRNHDVERIVDELLDLYGIEKKEKL